MIGFHGARDLRSARLLRSDVNDGMVEQVARRWLLTNPDAAEPWLRDSRLPEFQKDRLLREAGR